MKANAIQVAIDILRELGHEDMAKWVEQPDAVRMLLDVSPFGDGERCESCQCDAGESHQTNWVGADQIPTHCAVAEAWRALGDPRGAADIERAHEEALRQHSPGRWVTLDRTPAGRIMQVEALLADGLITAEMARLALDYPTGMAGGIVTLTATLTNR